MIRFRVFTGDLSFLKTLFEGLCRVRRHHMQRDVQVLYGHHAGFRIYSFDVQIPVPLIDGYRMVFRITVLEVQDCGTCEA